MNKKTFYTASFTWGLPMTLCGLVVALSLMAAGHRPKRFLWGWCFEVGERWGGLNLGIVIFCEKGSSDRLKCHEFGHSLQNCLWGIFTPFVVHIPSAMRYWVYETKAARVKELKPYYSVWYEDQATRWGTKYYNKMKDEDVA